MKKIKGIIFDLDGVLVDTKDLHYELLNNAIRDFSPNHVITKTQHYTEFDGKTTREKLSILVKKYKLDQYLVENIWKRKQEYTKVALEHSNNFITDARRKEIQSIMAYLQDHSYKIGICTNSIKETTYSILENLGIFFIPDVILTNDHIHRPKPFPDIYNDCIKSFNLFPDEVIIFEDSPTGLKSAHHSNANVVQIHNISELTLEFVKDNLYMDIKDDYKSRYFGKGGYKWSDKQLNILIPMAGDGKRFTNDGYKNPKPFIELFDSTIINSVVNNLQIKDCSITFIVRAEHLAQQELFTKFLANLPKDIKYNFKEIPSVTEGAACTSLLAESFIDNDNPLLIVNSDQLVEWNANDFYYKMQNSKLDGCILTFKGNDPKWSFAKIENGKVLYVAEKNPISDDATVGMYYWKKGSDYVKYAKQMIQQDKRVNGEFYICPVYNEAISDGKNFTNYEIVTMHGLGDPDSYLKFKLTNYPYTNDI